MILALLVGLVLLPGCVDSPADDGPAGDGTDDGQTYEECEALDLGSGGNGSVQVARIDCEANVTGENAAEIRCPQPEDAELMAGANLTSGQVEIRVRDGADQVVARHRVSDTGGEGRQLSIPDDAEPGNWTLTGERLDNFEGRYAAELSCPQG